MNTSSPEAARDDRIAPGRVRHTMRELTDEDRADAVEFLAAKWVKVMADHSADALWDREGFCWRPELLPIPPALVARLHAWEAWYETNRIWAGDDSFDYPPFAAEGLAIARAVKAALPDWTVVYVDEAAWERERPASFGMCEYEVT